MEIRERPQDNNHSGSWMSRIGDGRADRYRQYTTDGEDLIACHAGDVCFVSSVAAYRILSFSESQLHVGGPRFLPLPKHGFALIEMRFAFILC